MEQQFPDVFLSQCFELKDLGTGKEGRDNGKIRIFRCGTDESEEPVFHMGQEAVLLGYG